jgi:hypothetical protein
MPDFYFKSKNETRSAPAARPRLGKRGTSLRRRVSKRNGGGNSVPAFLRNGAKYATLPVSSRSGGGRDKTGALSPALSHAEEKDHHSDTEHCGSGVARGDFSDEEEQEDDDKAGI